MHSELKFPGMSGAQVEALATDILRNFQPDALQGASAFDIERFVDLHLESVTGVQPDYQELPPGIDGMTDQNRMVINLALAESHKSRRYLRSTMAHETGHALIHVPVLRKYGASQIFEQISPKNNKIQLYRRKDLKPYEDPEWQAWRFARALMMPENVIRHLVREGLPVWELARHFDINVPFVETRLRELKLVC